MNQKDLSNLERLKTPDLLEEVSRRGFISTKRERIVDQTYRLPRRLKPYKIGLISDTHYGSTKQQLTLTHRAYEIFEEEKVIMVIHAGDICDGNGHVYTGQEYEIFLHGADNQVDYIVQNYPRASFPTKFITGN